MVTGNAGEVHTYVSMYIPSWAWRDELGRQGSAGRSATSASLMEHGWDPSAREECFLVRASASVPQRMPHYVRSFLLDIVSTTYEIEPRRLQNGA